jgi:hypothetical protein
LNAPSQRAILFASAISEFYPEGVVPSSMAMATAMVSLLTNVLDPMGVMGHGVMDSALKQAGISPTIREFRTAEDVRELANTPRIRRFLEMFSGHNLQLFSHHDDQPLIMMGIILLTIRKQVNAESYRMDEQQGSFIPRGSRHS